MRSVFMSLRLLNCGKCKQHEGQGQECFAKQQPPPAIADDPCEGVGENRRGEYHKDEAESTGTECGQRGKPGEDQKLQGHVETNGEEQLRWKSGDDRFSRQSARSKPDRHGDSTQDNQGVMSVRR